MSITNIILIILVIGVAVYVIYYSIKKKKNAEVEQQINIL